MKKLLLMMTAVAVVMAGCKEPEDNNPTAKVSNDSIEIEYDGSSMFPDEGGDLTITVLDCMESGWTVESEQNYDWVIFDPDSGEKGEEVYFQIDPNEENTPRVAKFTFKSGEAYEDVFIEQVASGGEMAVSFDLVGEDTKEVDYQKSQFFIEFDVNPSFNKTDVAESVAFTDGQGWVKPVETLRVVAGESVKVRVYFEVEANDGFDARKATLTIASDKTAEPQKVYNIALTQTPADKIVISGSDINYAGREEYDFTVEVESNLSEYAVGTGGAEWVTQKGDPTVEGRVKTYTFTIAAMPTGVARSTTITFTGGMASGSIKVTQSGGEAVISSVADLTGTFVMINMGQNYDHLNLGEFTLEMLYYPNNFDNSISTLFGIEGEFLMRCGDNNNPDQIQLVFRPEEGFGSKGMPGSGEVDAEHQNVNHVELAIHPGNTRDPEFALTPGQWHHIAVTYSKSQKTATMYINGVSKGSVSDPSIEWGNVNFGLAAAQEVNDAFRNTYINYSYDEFRGSQAKYSEFRIWNKVLTASELADMNRWYSVSLPVPSELVAYWKMNETSGSAIADHSGNGVNIAAGAAINWTPVSLPQ